MSLLVDIQKDFGKFKLNVKFNARNEVVGLLGASGCGKSMTLKCIAGIVTPDRGKIVVDGNVLFDSEKKINISPQKRHVGLLFQNYALFPNMTVYQNIYTGIHREKIDRRSKEEAVRNMIEKFHLTGLEKRKPGQLSGGQQQRAALARILVTKPEILMLDEPFSALDSYLRWELETELADILDEYAKTVILVSHDRDEIYRLCVSACAISDGTAAECVRVDQMFTNPQSISEALLSGCKNISSAHKLSSHTLWARDWGLKLRSKTPVPDNLKGVGIQSSDIRPAKAEDKTPQNYFACHIERCIKDPLSYIYILAAAGEPGGEKRRIRMDVPCEIHQQLTGKKDISVIVDEAKLMLFCR